MNSATIKGAVAGALLAAIVVALVVLELQETLGLEEFTRLLAATPLFAFDAMRNASQFAQGAVLVLWWIAIGGALGWALGHRDLGGILFATVLAIAVVAGHVGTKNSIERQIESAVKSFGKGVQQMLKQK